MLTIDLETLAECCNPFCRAEIEPPDDQRRYCPTCGAAQVYECPACPTRPGALIRVAQDLACPRCGAVYVLCERCWHPIAATADGPMACPEGCDAGLTEARTGTYAPGGNVGRTGAVTYRRQRVAGGEPRVWRLGEPVSRPVCRFGRLFFATARGTVRCLNEETGEDVPVWQQQAVFDADPVSLADVPLEVSTRAVCLAEEEP